MDEAAANSVMYQIGVLKQDLERRSSNLLGSQRIAFNDMSIRSPRFSPPELGFYQALTWMYVFYYEAGRVSIPFLMQRFSTYDCDQEGKHRRHYKDVRRLRTFLQHNLNLDSSRDSELQRRCAEWFAEVCGSALPGSTEEWYESLLCVLRSAEGFLQAAIDCVREIERDQSSGLIIEQWETRIHRYHPKHEFERLVRIVIHDIGQDSLDAGRITERYYDSWVSDLNFRSDDLDFEEEGRRLIERTLLNEREATQPITGADIIKEYGIQPGPEVGRLLRESRKLYLTDPCSKAELLERLSNAL